jgi:hypothetical protein
MIQNTSQATLVVRFVAGGVELTNVGAVQVPSTSPSVCSQIKEDQE